MGVNFFRVPVEMLEKVLDAIVKVRLTNEGTAEDNKLLEDFELNDEGRIAKIASRYMCEERELRDQLAEYGLTPEEMRQNKTMGDLMKGRTTNTPVPIKKMVNGE